MTSYNITWLDEVTGYFQRFTREFKHFCLATNILNLDGGPRSSDIQGGFKSRNGNFNFKFETSTGFSIEEFDGASFKQVNEHQEFLKWRWDALILLDSGQLVLRNVANDVSVLSQSGEGLPDSEAL